MKSAKSKRRMVAYLRKRRAKARMKGLCIWCDGKTVAGAICESCRGMRKLRYHELREAGLCVRCGEPADGWACEPCREADNAKRRK